jgi:hypothetical protein
LIVFIAFKIIYTTFFFYYLCHKIILRWKSFRIKKKYFFMMNVKNLDPLLCTKEAVSTKKLIHFKIVKLTKIPSTLIMDTEPR